MKGKKIRDYYAMFIIYDAGSMPKAFRIKIAKWMKKTADSLIKDGDNYTRSRFTAKMMK